MTNVDNSLNSIETPIVPSHETIRPSGFTKEDEDKLNHLANESANRSSNTIKNDEHTVPSSTIVSNI